MREYKLADRVKCPYCGYMMRILEEKEDVTLCYCASCKEDFIIRTNNHQVDCIECLHSVIHEHWIDGVSFRIGITCRLNHKTNYCVPFSEYWDCEDFEEWTVFKALKRRIKKLIGEI